MLHSVSSLKPATTYAWMHTILAHTRSQTYLDGSLNNTKFSLRLLDSIILNPFIVHVWGEDRIVRIHDEKMKIRRRN